MLITFTNVTGISTSSRSGLSKVSLVSIVLGTIVGVVTLSVVVTLLILRVYMRKNDAVSTRRHCEYLMFMKLGCFGRHIMIFHFPCNCFCSTF
jgi:nitrate reductase gamma subunit